ncbi:MAG: hypothetical protein AAGA48_21190 [Myxococcota bacterium]
MKLRWFPFFAVVLTACDPLEIDDRLDQLEADVASVQETVDTLLPLIDQMAKVEGELAALRTTQPEVSVVAWELSDYLFLDDESDDFEVFAEVPYAPSGPGVLLAQLHSTIQIVDPGRAVIALGRQGDVDASASLYATTFTLAHASTAFAYRTEGEPLDLEVLSLYDPEGPNGSAILDAQSTKLVLTFFPDPPPTVEATP